jgi:benzoyl-CoA reductase/2-hydroxyglutaryl-CoA dehydratase subunit BcrC/BadD/HgdB
VIVAEDHCWGNRCSEFPLDPSMPPFEALAERYHRKPACSIEFPMARVVDRCLARATSARVDGALFFVLEDDGVHVWDTSAEIAAFEQAGIPCLHLKQQPYWITQPDPLRATIQAFVDRLTSSTG